MAEEKKKKDRRQVVPRNEKRTEKGRMAHRHPPLLKNTGTVLLCSLVVGVCIWIFDYVAVSAVHLLIGLAG